MALNTLQFDCQRCGRCCQGDGWLRNVVHAEDVALWKKEGRADILRYVCETCTRLVDPDNGNAPWTQKNCPFLDVTKDGASCRIYSVRPRTCRNFPVSECTNPKCPEKYHLHDWLWQGRCKAARSFRRDMVRAIEHLLSQERL